MPADLSISVIVPTWNEGLHLSQTLASVLGQKSDEVELIVVDAGSTDDTAKLAERFGSKVIHSPRRQRACQLNLGASAAQGNVLLFLHGDTLLPAYGFRRMQGALSNESVCGGAFARRFDSPSRFLKLTCCLAEVRNKLIGWHLGDQGLFTRSDVFHRVGGFKEWDRFEDLDFSRRLASQGKIVTLRPPVISSARRFKHDGPWKRTMRDFFLTLSYLRGKPEAIMNERARTDSANCETRMGAH